MMQTQLIGGRLVESSAAPTRRRWALVVSTAVHGVVIVGAVAATIVPKAQRRHDDAVPTMRLVMYRAPSPAIAPASLADRAVAPAPRGFQVLIAPREIPRAVEAAVLPARAIESEDFSGRGVLGGIAAGIAPSRLATTGNGTGDAIDAGLADEQPYLLPGQIGPAYPDELRDYAPDGLVVARFIIDTLGRAEAPSIHLLESSGPLFAESVRTALDRMRYAPARMSGRRVRARVEQRFEFHLAGP